MTPDAFARYCSVLHDLTVDFARAVPDDRWDFNPIAPGQATRPAAPGRIAKGFAPFNKQLRHVVCVRGVYAAALATGRVDWSRKHDHYAGPLTREALLTALDAQQHALLAILRQVDLDRVIDWDGSPFTFATFTWEYVQHEAIHHGQWSLYAALAGFDTPASWRSTWGL
ncbi:MAG: DinB family protein [Myxococcales bacterium]|nr:DinB family protein [Myxococcales bacterium]